MSKLRKQFEKETGCKAWVNSRDLVVDGITIPNSPYAMWLESKLESQQQESKEYNMRDRATIVLLAQRCAKHLTAQPLIDWFNKPQR